MRASFEAEKADSNGFFFLFCSIFVLSVLEIWAHGEIIFRSINGWIL